MRSCEYGLFSFVLLVYYSATKSDGGRLLLTNQRLIFCAHALNINPNLYWELSLKEVKSSRTRFKSPYFSKSKNLRCER